MMKNNLIVKYLRILYPTWMLIAIMSLMIVPSLVIVEGDARQTAENLASREFLFRLGLVGSMITQILFIIIPLLLYQMFKSVNKNQALMMVVLALISVPITMHNEIQKLTAVGLMSTPEQMMQVFERTTQAQLVSYIFWGLWLFPLGHLVRRSGFFPKILGVLLSIAGVGYVLGSLVKILALKSDIFNTVFEVLTLGEVVFILWFVIRGVKKGEAATI